MTLFILILALAVPVFATPSENAPIWRVQIRFQTANVADAGTDDSVRVQLNDANGTWLDYARDDFPRNNTFTYDLKLDGINRISDLDYIFISKTGDDGLCLKSFALLINGREIYTETFAGAGRWLDTGIGYSPTYFVSGTTMRRDNSWLAYAQPPLPQVISGVEMASRVEGIVGDLITGNKLQWDGGVRVIKVRNAPANRLYVELFLEYDRLGPNPDVYVHFDLEFGCSNNQITLEVQNLAVQVTTDNRLETLSLELLRLLNHFLTKRLEQGLKNLSFSGLGVSSCPTINIDNDGNIHFTFPPRTFPVLLPVTNLVTAAESNEAKVKSQTSLTLNVELANQIQADAETAFILVAKSNRDEAANVNVQLTLPSQILPVNGLIEVVDADRHRTLATQALPGENGAMVLSFNDQLAAHSENHYRLHVRFLYARQADLPINATLSEEGHGVTIKSTTLVQMENGIAKAHGTLQTLKAVKVTALTSKEAK